MRTYEKHMCRAEGCANEFRTTARPFCKLHWKRVPEDLQERMRWAVDDAEPTEYEAAVTAITEHLSEGM